MDERLLELRRRGAALRSSRARRVLAHPLRLPLTKALATAARVTGRPLAREARLFWGGRMTVVLPEPVSAVLLAYGFFEEGLTAMLLERLQPGMVFFDVGAHFGYFTLLASELVGPEGRVHAFEPTPSTFAVLRRNAAERPNVVLNRAAAFSREGAVTLVDRGVAWGSFNALAADGGGCEAGRRVEVEAVTLDGYVRRTRVRPGFVKLDAEGVEAQILAGSLETLAAVRPLVSVEVGDERDAQAAPSRAAVDLLLEAGYDALEYADGRLVPHRPPRGPYAYDNLLFVPR